MIRTSLINGVINLDSDFSKYIESLSKPGVIEGLNVQDGVVKPGKARVKAERTNGETIYCYVENTEDVSLSGNDGKVYIVIDQEDIDSGLVREDGINIARIEEGANRPVKNFLKIWSKTGAIIKDERDIIKKIDEVNEDIEDEISGIDTRLTEAEHDIQQIIEQSGSALSYLDTTCYAGEEIHENDLIVTNGNSFNPDRTDESTDVGGQIVNKYAIGFIGNGESADTFLIKTSVNLGTEPDTVTVNLETDDNGEPSGTVIETTDIASGVIASGVSTTQNVTTVSINDDFPYHFNTPGKGFFRIYPASSGHRYLETSNGYKYYFYDADGNAVTDTLSFLTTSFDDKTIAFMKTVSSPSSSVLVVFEFTGNSYIKKGERALTDSYTKSISSMTSDGKTVLIKPSSTENQKILVSNTPFDFSEYTTYTPTTTIKKSTYNNEQYFITRSLSGNLYLFTLVGTNGARGTRRVFSVGEDYEVTSLGSFTQRSHGTNSIGYDNGSVTIFAWADNSVDTCNEIKFVGDVYYGAKVTGITFGNTITTTKNEKYRLTIAPVKTGSVINCLVVFDKEGEYYSELAVKDLNNWSNVSNKTPYIDSSCIKARYARKANENDRIYKIPCGFSNGDFTTLEPVNYCFKGVKGGFNNLVPDSSYYFDNNGGITKDSTVGPYVGCAVSDKSLIIDFKKFGGTSNRVNQPDKIERQSSESTQISMTKTAVNDERFFLTYTGVGGLTVNGVTVLSYETSGTATSELLVKKGDVLVFTCSRFSSSYGGKFEYFCCLT